MAIKEFLFDAETKATTNPVTIQKISEEEKSRPCPGKPTSANPRPDTIERYESAKAEWRAGLSSRIQKKIDDTAKNPLLAEPICMSAICDQEKVSWSAMHGDTEKEMLINISEFITDNCDEETEFSGFCITIFDLPLLVTRCRLHRVSLPGFFPQYHRYWHGNVIDIKDLIPSKTPFLSFDDAATLHGLDGKSLMYNGSSMHGGRVQDAFRAGEFDFIVSYCDSDALNEWELLKMCKPIGNKSSQTIMEQAREILGSNLSDSQKVITINNILFRIG